MDPPSSLSCRVLPPPRPGPKILEIRPHLVHCARLLRHPFRHLNELACNFDELGNEMRYC
jgi:hypothetical protein